MRYLLALTLAVLLVAIPSLALASQVMLIAQLAGTYPRGHHYQVEVSSLAFINDSTTSVTSDMDGYFDPAGSANFGGGGVITWETGPATYLYISGSHPTFIPGTACILEWNGDGCTLYITSLYPGSSPPIRFQLDYYTSPFSEWIAWVYDSNNALYQLGTWLSPIDSFTNIKLRQTENYAGPTNPWVTMAVEFEAWKGWSSTWIDLGTGVAYTSWTAPSDQNFCSAGRYGFIGIPLDRNFLAGSPSGFPYFCLGTVS